MTEKGLQVRKGIYYGNQSTTIMPIFRELSVCRILPKPAVRSFFLFWLSNKVLLTEKGLQVHKGTYYGNQSTTIMPTFRELFVGRILPKAAAQEKNTTLGGTLDLQIIFQGNNMRWDIDNKR